MLSQLSLITIVVLELLLEVSGVRENLDDLKAIKKKAMTSH